ncbi:MAG TPA: hypothetical protein PKV58_04450 [Kaistella sp.]|nr:hypothetical protein [Kaistella sp.]
MTVLSFFERGIWSGGEAAAPNPQNILDRATVIPSEARKQKKLLMFHYSLLLKKCL